MAATTRRSQIIREAVTALGPTCTAQDIRDWCRKNRGDGLVGHEFSAHASNCRKDVAAKLKAATNGTAHKPAAIPEFNSAAHDPAVTPSSSAVTVTLSTSPAGTTIALVKIVKGAIAAAGSKEALKELVDLL